MWSIPCLERNCKEGSKEKGSSLSEKSHLGVPYCKRGLVSVVLYCQRSWNEHCI